MNLFVTGWSASGQADGAAGERALAALLNQVPFLPDAERGAWRSPGGHTVCAWAQHAPERVGGVRYVASEPDRMALFAGRPIRWTGDEEADGRSVLDPGLYLREEIDAWAPELDARFAVVRAQGDRLDVVTDPLGGCPLWAGRSGDTWWVSTHAELVRRLIGTDEVDRGVLASVMAGGSSLEGHPAWAGVERLPVSCVVSFAPGEDRRHRALWPVGHVAGFPDAGLDAPAAARTLVATVRALADWPGRPSLVPVTAGRDSRLILAAALAAGIDFTAVTGGGYGMIDVDVGRQLCERVGIAHELVTGDPAHNVWSHSREAAALATLTMGGTGTLADGSGFPLVDDPGPAVLWHTGLGGEASRRVYDRRPAIGARPWARLDAEAIARRLYTSFAMRRPGRPQLVAEADRPGVQAQLRAFVDAHLAAGIAPADLPDTFYIYNRLALWCGPTQSAVDWVKDSTAAMWTRRMLPHMLALPRDERAADRFHLRMLEELRPDLIDIPFEHGEGWLTVRSPRGRQVANARRLAGRAADALLRRARARRGALAHRRSRQPAVAAPPPAPPEAFVQVHETARALAAERPDHPGWEAMDRSAVERLLARDTAELDEVGRFLIWRLVTVLAALPGSPQGGSNESRTAARPVAGAGRS
jgi:hypothetical protein